MYVFTVYVYVCVCVCLCVGVIKCVCIVCQRVFTNSICSRQGIEFFSLCIGLAGWCTVSIFSLNWQSKFPRIH